MLFFHQLLEAFGEGRFAAANRAQQIKNLFSFFETLGGVLEVADDPFDRFFHTEEILKGRINLDCAIEVDFCQPGIRAGIDDFRLADCRYHPFSCAREHHEVVATAHEVVGEGYVLSPLLIINL